MKKNVKRIFVLLLVVLQLALLCGCDALDQMRENQAFLQKNGDVLWNGNIYKPLPPCEYLQPGWDSLTTIFVTEPDVPVLLSGMNSALTLYAGGDNTLLQNYHSKDASYCIESEYEAMCARINAPFQPDIICYSYSYYDPETEQYEGRYYDLTQEQVDAIKLVVETTEPVTLQDGMYLDYQWSLYLEECSTDRLFRRHTMDICYSGSTYYLELYTDSESVLFAVPEGCNDTFDQIVQEFLNAEGIHFTKGEFPLDQIT